MIKNISLKLSVLISLILFSHVLFAYEAEKSAKPEQVIVTSTREEKPKLELSESVVAITETQIEDISPSHPAEVLNRIAGVHINNLGGEGHMTAIRQPITTSGVYLFLEDGVPTRPSGFFNHNGLYEINIPQSSRVEITKGPGSALYGSEAIGGIINSVTKVSPESAEFGFNAEGGSHSWTRGLLSAGAALGQTGFRMDHNFTDNQGFRDAAEYDRSSTNFRLDSNVGENSSIKLIAAYSEINQSGVSGLEEDDYRNNTALNWYHNDIGYREVEATRFSAEYNYAINEDNLISITPYYRDNTMNMIPSWMVTYDPNIRQYQFESFGALIKYRAKYFDARGELIIGLDYDNTPSEYREDKISVTREGKIFTDYALLDEANYFFETEQKSISPYVHAEYQINENLRVNAGIRHDSFEVDYTNFLDAALSDCSHCRPESQVKEYEKTSPKLGAVYQLNENNNIFVNHRYAFRAPTVGALFRSGSTSNTADLKPVSSRSTEFGYRVNLPGKIDFEFALYSMDVEDDIVSVISAGTRNVANAGETSHRGVEVGFDTRLSSELQLGVSFTYSEQEYDDFSYVFFDRSCFCSKEINFSGNKISKAPERMGNIRLAYVPEKIRGLRTELEWVSMGSYFTDQTNTFQYDGHDLLNLRTRYRFDNGNSIYLRLQNLTDRLYSTYTTNQVGNTRISYRPGMPRSVFAGFRIAI